MSCSPEPLSLAPQPSDQTPLKGPRRFGDGAVGLGIVAAMNAGAADFKRIAAQLRSEPIPIVSPRPRPRGEGWADAGEADEDKGELSESYTCVISHVAGSAVRKRVYFDDGSDGVRRNYGASPGVFFQSPPAMKAADLMNRCYLCAKNLQGLDIFMYWTLDFLPSGSWGPGSSVFYCSGMDFLEDIRCGGEDAARLGFGVTLPVLVHLGGEECSGFQGFCLRLRSGEGPLLLSSPGVGESPR